jgi:hypothetical protein
MLNEEKSNTTACSSTFDSVGFKDHEANPSKYNGNCKQADQKPGPEGFLLGYEDKISLGHL